MSDLINTISHTTLHTVITDQLKTLASTNPYPVTGGANSIYLETNYEDIKSYAMEAAQEGDVIVGYDFCTDEISARGQEWEGSEEQDWLDNWYYSVFEAIDVIMAIHGYQQVDECDGSGGGLWYGGMLFRK